MKINILLFVSVVFCNAFFAQVPTLNCPSTISVPNVLGQCGAIVNYTVPSCATNCSGTTIYQSDISGLTTGDFFPVGSTFIEYTISNGSDSSTCLFEVVVLDIDKPVLIPNGDIDQFVDVNCSFTVPDYNDPQFAAISDNCGIDYVVQTPAIGTTLNTIGSTHLITLTGYDYTGNFASCSFTITLKDSTAPTITCPGTITEPTTSGCQGLLQNYIALTTVTDNCDNNPTVSQVPAPGTTFTTSQMVTIYAEDVSGNIDSCSFTVVTNDIIAPSISCPGNIVEYVNADCEYLIPDFTGMAVTSDNCDPSVVVTQSPAVGNKFSGANTTHFVSLQATDVAGNSSVCSFQITLTDTLAPTFANCQDITVPLNNNCEYVVTNLTVVVGINENCSAFTTQQIPAQGVTISGATTTSLFIVADDLYGNSNTCFANIITIDTTSPNIATCPSNMTVSTGSTNCNYVVQDYSPDVFAIDNCTSALSITQSELIGSDLLAGSTTNIVMTVTDDAGNFSTCDFDITVVDLVAPSLPCPVNPDVYVNSNCEYVIPSFDTVINITDNCGTVASYTQTPVAGTIVSGVGTQQSISLFVEDDHGNTNSCSFIITLEDTTAPVLTCPNTQSVTIDGNCQYVIPDLSTLATFSDFCDSNPTFAQTPAAGTTVSGILNVNIVVTDASGNTNTCAVQTQPDDQINPTLTCPSDTASCTDIFTFNTPFGNDNCGLVTVSQTDLSGLVSGDSFPVGITTIEFTATDEVGNTATCDFNITVYPSPNITTISSVTIEEVDSVQLVTTIDAYDNLTWTPNYNLTSDTILSPWASPNATTTYVVSATSIEGCESSSSVVINVNQIEELIINNFVSPNGDGKNELWTMNKPSLISGCNVSIYDRWAKLVWETDSYGNQWDGTNLSGEPLPDGTYFYSIVCPGQDDITGSILLIR